MLKDRKPMVKNRAAKIAARELKESTGITYPRALDLVRLTAGSPSPFPALRIGWSDEEELTWQPDSGSVLEVAGAAGTGKSVLLCSMAEQGIEHIETYVIDLVKFGADYRELPDNAIISEMEKARNLADALEAEPRPALIFCDELQAWSAEARGRDAELVEMLERLTAAGAAIVTASQRPEGRWSDSSRILVGANSRAGTITFLGHRGLEPAGELRGYFSPAEAMGVTEFSLMPHHDVSGPLRMETLGLPEAVRAFADLKYGLYLFAGHLGSGRTSSMAAVLNEISRPESRHFALIEETPELHPDRAHVVRLKTGMSSSTAVVKEAMRLGPDAIVIGEIRDAWTMMGALGAAGSGHAVYATIHADSVADITERVRAIMPAEARDSVEDLLTEVLRGALFQELVTDEDGARRPGNFEVLIPAGAALL